MRDNLLLPEQVEDLLEWCRRQGIVARLETTSEGEGNQRVRVKYTVISVMDQQARYGKIYRAGEPVMYRHCMSSSL